MIWKKCIVHQNVCINTNISATENISLQCINPTEIFVFPVWFCVGVFVQEDPVTLRVAPDFNGKSAGILEGEIYFPWVVSLMKM